MNKQELYNYFQSIGILNKKGGRKYCWSKLLVNDALKYFIEYSKNYRSDEEAWFCLSNMIEPHKCEICGNLAKFTGSKKSKISGYNTVCENCSANAVKTKVDLITNKLKQRTDADKKTSNEKRKRTCLEKYGESNYNQYGSNSFKKLMLERYNDPYYNNHKKAEKTCLEKYGVKCNFMIDGFQEKALKIKQKRYGNPSNYEKIKLTNLKRYGVEHIGQNSTVQEKTKNTKKLKVLEIENMYNCTHQQKLIKKYGQGWLHLDLIKLNIGGRKFIKNEDVCIIKQYSESEHTNNYVSKKEKELLDYIKSIYNGVILENATNIIQNNNCHFYELDIFLPEINIAFEFNGTYWHSSKFKDKYYHQRKMINCYKQNIQLIHIYECDWDNNLCELKQKIANVISNTNYGIAYGWIPVSEFDNYILGEPEVIYEIDNNKLYNEGKFNLKTYENNNR